MLHDTSSLLSGLTSYAALVMAPPAERATVRSLQVVGLAPHLAMAVAVLSNGAVEKVTIELDDDVGDERLGAASTHLGAHLGGTSLGDPTPVPATGDIRVDRVVDDVRQALGGLPDRDRDQIFVGGASSVAGAFDAVDTVRKVLAILEQQYVVVSVLREVLEHDAGEQHGLSV